MILVGNCRCGKWVPGPSDETRSRVAGSGAVAGGSMGAYYHSRGSCKAFAALSSANSYSALFETRESVLKRDVLVWLLVRMGLGSGSQSAEGPWNQPLACLLKAATCSCDTCEERGIRGDFVEWSRAMWRRRRGSVREGQEIIEDLVGRG